MIEFTVASLEGFERERWCEGPYGKLLDGDMDEHLLSLLHLVDVSGFLVDQGLGNFNSHYFDAGHEAYRLKHLQAALNKYGPKQDLFFIQQT